MLVDNSPVYFDEGDGEFAKFLKSRKSYPTEEHLDFKFRFLNEKYLNSCQDHIVKQEAVLKIISNGRGCDHLNTLMKYIAREQGHQKDEEKASVFDCFGQEVSPDDFSSIIAEWSKDFADHPEYDADMLEGMNEAERIKGFLGCAAFGRGLSEDELRLYEYSRKFSDKTKVPNNYEEGTFILNRKFGVFGFLGKDLDDGRKEFLSLRGYETVNIPITGQGCENFGHRIKDKKIRLEKDFTHILLSPGGSNPDKDLAKKATEDFLKRNFRSQGFEYVYAMHEDTKNLHFHVIVKKSNVFESKNKLFFNKYQLHDLRQDYTACLDGYGINRSAVLHRDREKFLESLDYRYERFTKIDSKWWDHKLSDKNNRNFDILKFRRRCVRDIDYLCQQFAELARPHIAKKLRAEREKFVTMSCEDISFVLDSTRQMLEKEEDMAAAAFDSCLERTVKAGDYDFEHGNKREASKERYKQYLLETRYDLQSLKTNEISEEIEKRRAEAIKYVDQCLDHFRDQERMKENIKRKEITLEREYEKDRGMDREYSMPMW